MRRKRFSVCMLLLVGLFGLSMQAAHATFVGDLVYCDVNNDGVFNIPDGDFGLNGVEVTMTCWDRFTNVCFSGTTTTGPEVLNTGFLELLGELCAEAPLTWNPAGDVTGRYLFEVFEQCPPADRPVTCEVAVTGGLPDNCNVLGTPRVTAMGNTPARPVDTNQDQDFCDVQAGSIPPDDGPFPEGQPLGNTAAYGGCEARPDPAPGDGTYTVVIAPALDECSIYNDFAYKPPAPAIDIEKATNGVDADDPNAGDAPQIEPGDPVSWTYTVRNIGAVTLVNIMVTDDQGAAVSCPTTTLPPGGMMTCTANGIAEDLFVTSFTTVAGICGNIPDRPLYENMGTATGQSVLDGQFVEDVDPSHYCNPPGPDIDIEKATNDVDADDPNAGDAPQIAPGDPVTWTYVVTNTGDVPLVNVQVGDDQGVPVSCPQTTLAVGESITCTAGGVAEDLDNTGFTTVPGVCGLIPQRPLYENMGTATGETVAGDVVDDTDPSHYCNPPPPPDCGLVVQKSCEIPPPPAPAEGECEGRLQQFTMIWTGGPITISGPANDAAGGQVDNGDEVTFFGPFSSNDVVVEIAGLGESTFHVSCSDKDMDGDTTTNEDQQQVSPVGRDCGKFQGNGKGSSGINDWLLEGFIDKNNAVLDCTSDPEPGASECTFQAVAADCDFPNEDPDNLTWVYTGGGCAASDNQQDSGDLFCLGSVNGNLPVTITDDDSNVFTVEPGGVFTTTRSASKVFTLVNSGGTEENGRHVSCSQPLRAGDVYGSLTLAALDGAGLGTNILYSYLVSNEGPDPVTDIVVEDNRLGVVGGIASLQPGDSDTLTATAFLSETTTNIATVDGVGAPNAVCRSDSNQVVVTVSPPPPCEASIAFKELKEDVIKWTLSNASTQRKATMETLTLVFPAAYGLLKEVKLDGTIFKAGDSDTFPDGVASGQTITSDDWTETNVSKRQLDQGESRTLELKFTQKSNDFGAGDFDLTVTFEEGCMVEF